MRNYGKKTLKVLSRHHSADRFTLRSLFWSRTAFFAVYNLRKHNLKNILSLCPRKEQAHFKPSPNKQLNPLTLPTTARYSGILPTKVTPPQKSQLRQIENNEKVVSKIGIKSRNKQA